MILLWGLTGDAPMDEVRRELDEAGEPHFFLDQAQGLDQQIALDDLTGPCGWIAQGNEYIRIEDIHAYYLRPFDVRDMGVYADLPPDSPHWPAMFLREEELWTVADTTRAVVVNRPTAMRTNASKPYQCALIERFGFAVPETLLTTSPAEVRHFALEASALVYKSTSGVRSIVRRLKQEDEGDRLASVRWCPTQFQRLVDGEDVRVHVVGRSVFACKVTSQATDYRYGASKIEPFVLPPTLADRCVALTRGLGLCLAGVDLRHTPDDDWFCFEVNPSPAFSCFEICGLPSIAREFANLLTGRSAHSPAYHAVVGRGQVGGTVGARGSLADRSSRA